MLLLTQQAGLRERVLPVRIMVDLLLVKLTRAAEVAKLHHGHGVGIVLGVAHARQRVVAEGKLDDLRSVVSGVVRGAVAEGQLVGLVVGASGRRARVLKAVA